LSRQKILVFKKLFIILNVDRDSTGHWSSPGKIYKISADTGKVVGLINYFCISLKIIIENLWILVFSVKLRLQKGTLRVRKKLMFLKNISIKNIEI